MTHTRRKKCSGCHTQKVLSTKQFHKDCNSLDGYASRCIVCRNIKARSTRLLKKYGLTVEQWDAMYLGQRGRCAICQELPKRVLVVDHCHTSERVRGLLCSDCNTAIGLLRETPAIIERAASYVARHEGEQ